MITLISYLTAREGFKFVYAGPSSECLTCRFNYVCNSKLKVGQIYEVVKVYNIRNKCPINEYVTTVEVKEATLDLAVSRKVSVEGMTLNYVKIVCERIKCSNHPKCVPELIIKPVKIKILKVLNNVDCPKNFELSNVQVKIVDTGVTT
ncbi:MAG: UPF0179 family protein [Sulfolobales archaeon]